MYRQILFLTRRYLLYFCMHERRANVLALLTKQYIASAKPVASASLAAALKVSSATIRNDLSALEEEGYLAQPHTSSGRIPTRLAYEHYASQFIPPKRPPKALRKNLLEALLAYHGEALLQHIASLTAEMTGYAVVVRVPDDDSVLTLEIHLSALSSSHLLAVVVLANGLVRQLMVELSPLPDHDDLQEVEHRLRQLTLPVREMPTMLAMMARDAEIERARTYQALAEAWYNIGQPKTFSDGLSRLLSEPESVNPEFVKRAISQAEQPLEDLTAEALFSLHLDEVLAKVSMPLEALGNGYLMLYGPQRMRYPDVLMVMQGISESIAHHPVSN